MLEIRPESAGDIPAIRTLNDAAFEDTAEGGNSQLRASSSFKKRRDATLLVFGGGMHD